MSKPMTFEQIKELLKLPVNERERWLQEWEKAPTRAHCRGENYVNLLVDTLGVKEGESVIDWGCGTGRAGAILAKEHGCKVTLADFAPNCLDQEVKDALGENLSFVECDFSKKDSPLGKMSEPTDYGLCINVMEELPEEDVNIAIFNILSASKQVLFSMRTIDMKENVYLRTYSYWLRKFCDCGATVLRSNEHTQEAIFLVTSRPVFRWNRYLMNTDMGTLHDHIRINSQSGLPQVIPHQECLDKVILLAGGPSLNDFADEIAQERKNGMKLVTTNGTYKWALEHGLTPSLQVVIDAKETSARYVDPIVDNCKYIAATQVHPSLVNKLPKDRSWLFQVNTEEEYDEVIQRYYGKECVDWFPIPGGSTVTMRALCLLMALGYRNVIVYGLDSCLKDEQHHAYSQPENDIEKVVDIRVGKGTRWERNFKCHPWMASQAREFLALTQVYLKHMHLVVKGDGLIAHMIKTGADLPELEDF